MTCANYLGYACSCGGEWLEMAKVQIRRTDHNQYLVYTSVSHIHLRQPYTRHGPPVAYLPQTANIGTMCKARCVAARHHMNSYPLGG
jgi:hypothetical protein